MGRDAGGGSGATGDLSAVLENERRRQVLEFLAAEDGESSLVGMAEHLTERGDEDFPNTLVELHAVHLPALTDRGIARHDADASELRLVIDPDHVERAVREFDRR